MVFHFVFGLSLFCAAVHLYRERASGLTRARVVEVLLLYILCVQWGFGGAFLSIPHILMPDPIAESIGWEPGSPFQVELGFASLGTSIVGILCIWHRQWFWLAPIVAWSVFLLGAAYVHIEHIVRYDNFSPGNAGPVLFYDIIVPFLSSALFVVYIRGQRAKPAA